jgi:hypothetical protein
MGRLQAAAHRLKRALGISRNVLHCSGCNRAKDDGYRHGLRFISGPGVYLCESCLQTLTTRMAESGPPASRARCSFCGQLRATLSLAELQVCANCIRLMDNILAEDDVHRRRGP